MCMAEPKLDPLLVQFQSELAAIQGELYERTKMMPALNQMKENAARHMEPEEENAYIRLYTKYDYFDRPLIFKRHLPKLKQLLALAEEASNQRLKPFK